MQDLKLFADFMTDLWQFIKSQTRVAYKEQPESYWDGLVKDGDALVKKYDRHPLALKLTLAVIDYISGCYKKEMGN